MNDELKDNLRVISLVSKRGVWENKFNDTIYRFSRLVKRTKQQGNEIKFVLSFSRMCKNES